MPEGHTIHRIAKDHSKLLAGRRVRVSSPQGRFTDASLVDGVVLDSIEAYGKHLFHHWANGLVGHVHLGLFGKYRISRGADVPAPVGEVRMRMISDLGTIDLAGPTDCSIGTVDDRDAIVARLGPDPLRNDAEPRLAIERIRRSGQPIGALLLDQKVLAGVGNVYRAEALFVHGIRPDRPGNRCSVDELTALWATITAMLRQGVKDNRIVTLDRTRFPIPKAPSKRGETTYVYHCDRCRECDSVVRIADIGNRACYFCPTCQRR